MCMSRYFRSSTVISNMLVPDAWVLHAVSSSLFTTLFTLFIQACDFLCCQASPSKRAARHEVTLTLSHMHIPSYWITLVSQFYGSFPKRYFPYTFPSLLLHTHTCLCSIACLRTRGYNHACWPQPPRRCATKRPHPPNV